MGFKNSNDSTEEKGDEQQTKIPQIGPWSQVAGGAGLTQERNTLFPKIKIRGKGWIVSQIIC